MVSAAVRFVQSARSVSDTCLPRMCRFTEASGPVKVLRLAKSAVFGNIPIVPTTKCFGETFASTRVKELRAFVTRCSVSGRLSRSPML